MNTFETYFEESYASIKFSLSLKLVEIVFTDSKITGAQYKLALSKALVVLKQNDILKWLIDIGTKKHIPDKDKAWLKDYLIPDLIEAGINKIAFIISQGNFDDEQKHQLTDIAKIKNAEVHFYNSKEEAREWLNVL